MEWETPAFTEIDMSAEIGAYQSDFDPQPSPMPPFVSPRRRFAAALPYSEPEQD